ncbi:MAG: hypothetical protein RR416_05015, partial [Clostridia bacterium]
MEKQKKCRLYISFAIAIVVILAVAVGVIAFAKSAVNANNCDIAISKTSISNCAVVNVADEFKPPQQDEEKKVDLTWLIVVFAIVNAVEIPLNFIFAGKLAKAKKRMNSTFAPLFLLGGAVMSWQVWEVVILGILAVAQGGLIINTLIKLKKTKEKVAIQQSSPKPVAEIAPEPVIEVAPKRVVEVVPEPIVEIVPEPIVEVVPEPVVEIKPEPVAEVVPEPVAEVIPEPVVEVEPEPVVEVIPEPVVEVIPEPVAEVIPEPV